MLKCIIAVGLWSFSCGQKDAYKGDWHRDRGARETVGSASKLTRSPLQEVIVWAHARKSGLQRCASDRGLVDVQEQVACKTAS